MPLYFVLVLHATHQSVKHYEKYKHWYDVADLQTPVEPVVEEETPAGAVDIEMVVENKQVKTRKPRGK